LEGGEILECFIWNDAAPNFGQIAKGEGKIDQRLIKKVQTLNSSGKLSAIIFSKEKQGRICKECLEEMGVNIVHEVSVYKCLCS
jgi:hypothetical protein